MNRVLSIVALLLISYPADAQVVQGPATTPPAISVAEFHRRPVVGRLGVILGTCTEIRATIIAGRTLHTKGDDSRYLLNVTHVAGKPLTRPTLFHFRLAMGSAAKLVNDSFELHRVKTGKRAGSLSSKQIEELEKGYVGQTVRLIVYESGHFSGIPSGLPMGYRIWAGKGFHFSTFLNVVEQRR